MGQFIQVQPGFKLWFKQSSAKQATRGGGNLLKRAEHSRLTQPETRLKHAQAERIPHPGPVSSLVEPDVLSRWSKQRASIMSILCP